MDKHNSFTPADMRYATWDILMAGGYPVTGYGSTYMGGYRDPGPFNPDDPRNNVWAAQYQLAKHLLSLTEWWKLEPRDDWITANQPRGEDREVSVRMSETRARMVRRPPLTTCWLSAEPDRQYLAYGRGLTDTVSIRLGDAVSTPLQGLHFNPRTGVTEDLGLFYAFNGTVQWTPPGKGDWVLYLKIPE